MKSWRSWGSPSNPAFRRRRSRSPSSALAKNADRSLELLAEMIRRPAFATTPLETYRGRVVDDLRRVPDNPSRLMTQEFARAMYTEAHPFGPPPHRGPGAGDHARRPDGPPPALRPPRQHVSGGGGRFQRGRAGRQGPGTLRRLDRRRVARSPAASRRWSPASRRACSSCRAT